MAARPWGFIRKCYVMFAYQINNLKYFYHAEPSVEIDSMFVRRGTITGLAGPNGSGKSTLLKMLAFVDRPACGSILFKGKPAQPFSESVRFRVALLPQEPYLMKRSVYANIAYGLKVRSGRGRYEKKVHEALELVGLSGGTFAGRRWNELSGGEARRVALAARLVLRPEVLLLDEPTANVDEASSRLIRDASVTAREQWGTTLVIASHDSLWLNDLCDEVRVLHKGRLSPAGAVNHIPGPWRIRTDGFYEKTLGDGQRLVVNRPPSAGSVAAISPERINVIDGKEGVQKSAGMLEGIITRMALEKNTGDILAVITVGGVAFNAKISHSKIRETGLYPGMTVFISFSPDSVRWTDELPGG